jgi:CelD/BcsL family acetyltransferase involved in cellulose biosynthesis
VVTLERVALADVDWVRLDALQDRVLFQTQAWLSFVAQTQGAEPVVAVLRDGGAELGWFTGLVLQRFGLRILGAPLPGWSTQFMGFNLLPGTDRRAAFAALRSFAFGELRCVHLEVCDRWGTSADLDALGGVHDDVPTFVVDLRPHEDEIRGRMTSGTRQNMRKAARVGVVVEDAEPEGFAADYYAQLRDVFAKQRLVPTYSLRRVEALVEHLYPTGRLQLVRVRAPDGSSIATALVAGHGRTAYFWGGASWRSHQQLRPNEALFWHVFTTWKGRGAVEFDFGGGGEYKRKYGAAELFVPHARASRSPVLEHLRSAAKRSFTAGQRVVGALQPGART